MRIAAQYSFKNGLNEITKRYSSLLMEVKDAIGAVDASRHKTKLSKEKTKIGRMLYSPVSLNKAFQKELFPKG
ncbi:MAG: BglII/BstYI family type II restriction endonuclease, partial [Pyrinomonadaceae bacterium]